MNYRHIYHAGNFADVFKHSVLLALIESLSQKEKPWCYLDTHAGKGCYDLFSEEANKTLEYKRGISRIFEAFPVNLSPLLQRYLNLVKHHGYPRYYPGSPLLVLDCLRPNDRMILVEKNAEELMSLRQCFEALNRNQISIHHDDGYQALKAFLPPKERRGLIFIDPPFEALNEWSQIVQGLATGLKRFNTGIYAVWYPIKDKMAVLAFHNKLKELECKEILIAELVIYPEDVPHGLIGCGMVIINPPWQLDEALKPLVQELWALLAEYKSEIQPNHKDHKAGREAGMRERLGRYTVAWL